MVGWGCVRVCVIRVGGGREEEREGEPAAHLSHCAGEEEPDAAAQPGRDARADELLEVAGEPRSLGLQRERC